MVLKSVAGTATFVAYVDYFGWCRMIDALWVITEMPKGTRLVKRVGFTIMTLLDEVS